MLGQVMFFVVRRQHTPDSSPNNIPRIFWPGRYYAASSDISCSCVPGGDTRVLQLALTSHRDGFFKWGFGMALVQGRAVLL